MKNLFVQELPLFHIFVQPLSNSEAFKWQLTRSFSWFFYYSYWKLAIAIKVRFSSGRSHLQNSIKHQDDVILFKSLIDWLINLICSCSHGDHLASVSAGEELAEECNLWAVTSASQHWWQSPFFHTTVPITWVQTAQVFGVQPVLRCVTLKSLRVINILSLIALFLTIFQKLKNFRVLKARRKMKKRNILMLSATKT